MKILNRNEIERTGFAGIRENRIVTDSRLFGPRKKAEASEGYGQFIYLADANYEPGGESGMHSHEEVDIITIILKGRVEHAGSLEHGKNLSQGEVQVQRAGGEGFSHNEKNPDQKKNRILQVWALPEESGLSAAYKAYKPEKGLTRLYGGPENQKETFPSSTTIEILILEAGEQFSFQKEAMTYLAEGTASIENGLEIIEGDLNLLENTELTAKSDLKMIIIKK
jgi:hypothetical protein